MPKIAALGGLSSRGFGEFAQQTSANYIEDVFSTYLYTGNGSTQTITNGIDLSTKGGMVWVKSRSAATNNQVWDSARGQSGGNYYRLCTNTNDYQFASLGGITSFNTNGFSLNGAYDWNTSSATYASWTFRKQPKFFDVITYTGNGVAGRTVNHNLGSVPGMIIVKRTDSAADWQVYHRSLANTEYMVLNTNATKATGTTRWNSTTPTATEFSLGTDATVNANSGTYVAYLFANNAGGFGNAGTDSVVSCGSFVGNTGAGNGPDVNLGWEPQWILFKDVLTTDNWRMFDNIRGLSMSEDAQLVANLPNAEVGGFVDFVNPTSTGFRYTGGSATTYIYIAIRRGPMKTPTDATKVFAPVIWTGNNTAGRNIETGFTLDLFFGQPRTQPGAVQTNTFYDRLRGFSSTAAGNSVYLRPLNTDAEGSVANYIYLPTMNGFSFGSVASGSNQYNNSSFTMVSWNFKRAPGFFDIVCYTGTGSARTVSHNLGVAPELMIVKVRNSSSTGWFTAHTFTSTNYKQNYLDATNSANTFTYTVASGVLLNSRPTTSSFSSGGDIVLNGSGLNYVAYLFASCPGVSKVGSYTGNGSSLNIDCGFTNGTRFVLIKRTDDVGDWYLWDTARGIVSANDPHLSLNSTAAEVTTDDSIDPLSTGFTVNQVAATNVNVNAATYIYLAIA